MGMKKVAVLAVLPLLLTACVVPTAVVMTIYEVDGVTHVSTGKTPTKNTVSAAMPRIALFHLV